MSNQALGGPVSFQPGARDRNLLFSIYANDITFSIRA